jgi:hypothetical protein
MRTVVSSVLASESEPNTTSIGMAIRVQLPDTCWVPDPTGTGTEMIFYSWVASVPDPNRDEYGTSIFFSPVDNPMGT